MRYGYFSEELYEKYLTGETLVDGRSILRLLTDRANNGNRVAEEYMALIEPDNKKWRK